MSKTAETPTVAVGDTITFNVASRKGNIGPFSDKVVAIETTTGKGGGTRYITEQGRRVRPGQIVKG